MDGELGASSIKLARTALRERFQPDMWKPLLPISTVTLNTLQAGQRFSVMNANVQSYLPEDQRPANLFIQYLAEIIAGIVR